MVRRFKDGAELGPRHQPPSPEHPALDDRSLNLENSFENFVANQKVRQILSRRVKAEILQPLDVRKWTVGDALLHLYRIALLLPRARRTASMLGLIASRHPKIPRGKSLLSRFVQADVLSTTSQ